MDFGFLGKKAPTNPITAGFGSSFFTGTSNFLSSVSAKKDGIFSDLSNKVDSLIKGEEVVPTPPAFNRNPPRNVPPQHPLPQGQQRPLGFPPILPGNQPRGITPQQGFPPVLPDPKLARQQGLHTPRIGVPVALKSTPPPTTGVPHKVPEKTEPLASRRDLDGKTLQNGSGTTQDERDSLQESRIGSSGQPKPAQKPGQPTGERYPGQKPAERPIPKTAAERQSQRSSPSAEQGQRSSPTPAERQKPGERRGQRPGGPSDRPTAPGRKTPQPQSERQAQKTPSDRQRASPQPTERHSSRSSPTQRSKPEPVERRLSRSGKELSITERGQDQIERLRDQRPGQEPVTRRTSRGSQELTERHRSGQEPVDHRGQRASQESVDRYGPKGQEISDRQRPGQDPLDHSGRHPQRSGIDPADRHRSATDLSDPHKSSFGDPRDPRYQEAAELSQRTAGQPRSGPEPAQRRSQRSSPIPAQRRSQRSSPEPPQRRSQRIEQDYHDSIGSKATPSLRSQRSTELHSQRSIQDGHRLDRESIDRYSQRSIDDSLDRYGTRLDRESIERHSQRSFDEPISRQANQRTAPPLASQRGQRSGSDYFERHSSPEPADRPRVSRQTQRVTDDPERSVLRSPSSEAEYYHSHRAAPPLPDKHTQKVAPEPARRQTNRADRESDYYRHRPDHDIAKPTPIPADRHRSAFRPIDRPGRRSAPRLGEYTDRELTDRQRAVTSGRLSEPSERILRSPSSEELEREMSDRRSGKFTSGRRRSSTVDEMLFDDYVEPPEEQTEAPSLEAADTTSRRRAMNAMGDLISFDGEDQRAYNERRHKPTAAKRKTDRRRVSPDSSGGGYGGEAGRHSSIDSSGDEFGGEPYRRSLSMESEQSWDSTYGVESQPDDITLECMEFMKMFVEKIFLLNEEISQTEKAKFGELCQHQPGRLWFARYVNSQRVHNKKVDEQIFFRLVQYFSVVLFECHMAEDYTPAKSLMNMCFTFFYESQQMGRVIGKCFLYSFLREQPIWHSLRFWSAAFFDAVQCERARRPVCTSEDGSEEKVDDSEFRENVTFGQLGTFTCNMRSFGLSKDLCLEFLRKQSTIANLSAEKQKLLKDNILYSKE